MCSISGASGISLTILLADLDWLGVVVHWLDLGILDTLTLLDVEGSVVAQNKPFVGRFITCAFVLGGVLRYLPEHHWRRFLTAFDTATALFALPECQPIRRAVMLAAEHEHVDATVRLATGEVFRHTGFGIPGLVPGNRTGCPAG